MHELYDDLKEMCETLSRELGKTNTKMSNSSNISAGDMEYIDKLTHAIKSIKTTMAMMDSEYSNRGSYEGGYANRSYSGNYEGYEGMSHARGRGRNARRDSMGRYSSESGYSRNEMVDTLHDLMESAPDDRTRQEFQRFITKMQSM